jgi:hypothetical protein
MVGEGRGLPANAARLIDGRIRTAVERQIFRAAHHARPGTSVAHPRVVIMKLTSVVLVAFLGSAELACAAVSPEPDPYGDPGGMAGMDTGGAGATPSGGIGGSGASRLASGRGAAGSTPPPGATTPVSGGGTAGSVGSSTVGGGAGTASGSRAGSGGTASAPPSVCRPDVDHYCDGAVLQVCRADGHGFQDQRECASAPLCRADAGMCATPMCTPNATSCNGDTLQKCNADGTGYASSTKCSETCDPKNNTCRVCTPGASYCDGNSSVKCDATGYTMTKVPCAKLCVGPGICGDCNPSYPERDCPTSDPCQVPSCNAYTNKCEFRQVALHDTCSMQAGYGNCTQGGCLGFCTDRQSCDPVVVIKANVNGKYVTLTSDGHLLASATSKSSAARFAVHVDPRNTAYEMAFYSLDVRSYVAVDSRDVPLEVGAASIASPEAFTNLDTNGDYDRTGNVVGVTMTFWSDEVRKYVTAEDEGDSPLIANRDAIGPWEQFTLEFASP